MTTILITVLFVFTIYLAWLIYCHERTIDAMIEAHNITTDATIKKLRELNGRIEALEEAQRMREGEL